MARPSTSTIALLLAILPQVIPAAGNGQSSSADRPATRLASITIEGVDRDLARQIRRVMWLRPPGAWTWLTGRDRLTDEALERDLDRLRAALLERGFLEATVGPAALAPAEDSRVGLVIPIAPGTQYRLATLTLDSGPHVAREVAARLFPVAPDAIYDAAAVRRGVNQLVERYRDLGYAAATSELEEVVDRPTATVRVRIAIRPGPVYLVGRVRFRGHRTVGDRHLRQYVRIREGERFATSPLGDAARTIANLTFFSEVRPEVQLRPADGAADVIYDLEERPRVGYTVGGGVSGVEGASLSGSVEARSLLGAGEWTVLGEAGPRLAGGRVSYRDPFSLGRRLAWSLDAGYRRVEYPDETTDERLALTASLGTPAGMPWQGAIGFRFERSRAASDLPHPVPFLTPFLEAPIDSRRLVAEVRHDGTSGAYLPTRGLRISLGGQVAGGPFGGDLHLVRGGARFIWVRPLDVRRRHLLVLGARAERIWSFARTAREGLPYSERLFLGGEADLRGFDERRVGPRDIAGVVIGGDTATVTSAEYHLVTGPRVHLVGFIDAGNVWAGGHETDDLPPLRWDVGSELQVVVPMLELPFRLGYGVNIDRRRTEPRSRVFFSLGPRF